MEGKGEKKIKIMINAEEIEESLEIVVGFVGDKVRVHYLFMLELDNMLWLREGDNEEGRKIGEKERRGGDFLYYFGCKRVSMYGIWIIDLLI